MTRCYLFVTNFRENLISAKLEQTHLRNPSFSDYPIRFMRSNWNEPHHQRLGSRWSRNRIYSCRHIYNININTEVTKRETLLYSNKVKKFHWGCKSLKLFSAIFNVSKRDRFVHDSLKFLVVIWFNAAIKGALLRRFFAVWCQNCSKIWQGTSFRTWNYSYSIDRKIYNDPSKEE